MKYGNFTRLACMAFLSLLAFSVQADGLVEYLQNPDTPKIASVSPTPSDSVNTATSATDSQEASQLKNIIELVVAGIVAAALIIVILVIFLGRWIASREKKLIKELRMVAEENSDHIISAATTIREQEKETTVLTQNIRSQADELSQKQEDTTQYTQEIITTAQQVKEHEKTIDTASNSVTESMNKIQSYWNTQVNDTVDTISLFQHNLSENIDIASEGLTKLNENKTLSSELLHDFLKKHQEQNTLIENNSSLSRKVSENLNIAFEESNKLLDLLKTQQEQAETSLKEYSERLNNFEEQAYEQFDTSFQVADLARQELSANIDENRKHIETMRRQEEQSHVIKTQISKNLEALDYSKIVKISETLDTTQEMFEDIHHKVDDTRTMLDELKQIEEDIKLTASNVESAAKSHSLLDLNEEALDKQIDDYIEKTQSTLGKDLSSKETSNIETDLEKLITDDVLTDDLSELESYTLNEEKLLEDIPDEIIDALENPSDKIREATTVAISDFKLISGDSSTPLAFFRDVQKNKKK